MALSTIVVGASVESSSIGGDGSGVFLTMLGPAVDGDAVAVSVGGFVVASKFDGEVVGGIISSTC